MIIKQNIYKLLICLILVSFGFFGSLSHIFSFALIIFIFFNYRIAEQNNQIEFNAKIVFLALTGCFFFFLLNSIYHAKLLSSLVSLSPMLPIPLIGLLFIFQGNPGFKISSQKISQFSQISVLFAFLLYLLLATFFGPESIFYQFHHGRLKLFSGNTIPFSFVMIGLTIFCLFDWRRSKNKNRLIALFCLFIGLYLACFLSGTRSTLLSVILISPFLTIFLTNNLKHAVMILLPVYLISAFVIFIHFSEIYTFKYLLRVEWGLETLFLSNGKNGSVSMRLDMWSAAIKTISTIPLFGHNITEISNAFANHPHNDIFASIIAGGYFGGLVAVLSLLSPLIGAYLDQKERSNKLFFGFVLTFITLVTANVSTVFFNDITASWFAFTTYLIWNSKFSD